MKTELVAMLDSSSKGASAETDSSLHKSDCQRQAEPLSGKPMKKRIGPFSFYLHDVIGRGFSSVVYRGIRDNDKTKEVALKVVALEGMSSHRRLLLENQVKILKMVEHPYIVPLLDIYYTHHNCYIVMEYCEGGSLQARIDQKNEEDWPKAAHQIGMACQYLADRKIMHRDIKPANVLIKGEDYKLGDFGFGHLLGDIDEKLEEKYLIGSPLYMPPQALTANVYSIKGDAFAYGIFLYYLATRHFPWRGKDKYELMDQYQRRQASQRHLHAFPPKFKHYVNGLLERSIENRLNVRQIDLQIFRRVKKVKRIEQQLARIGNCYQYQIKICQFIHFLMNNFQKQQHLNCFLLPMMSKHLGQLVQVFGWHCHPYMVQLKRNYHLPIGQFQFSTDQYHWLLNCLRDTISTLYSSSPNSLSEGIMLKLLQYELLVKSIMYGQTQEISGLVESLTLHETFDLLRVDAKEALQMMAGVDFYQL